MKIDREKAIDMYAMLHNIKCDIGKYIYTDSWLDKKLKKSMMKCIDSVLSTFERLVFTKDD